MGVTIHFKGRLRGRAAMTDLLQFARRFASDRGWVTDEINEATVKLLGVKTTECDYLGPDEGNAISPHWIGGNGSGLDSASHLERTMGDVERTVTGIVEVLDWR